MKIKNLLKTPQNSLKSSIIGIIIWSLIITGLSLYATAITVYGHIGVFLSYFQNPVIVLINLIPILLLTLFFGFITNRIWLAYLLSALITMLMTTVNYLKIMIRNDPFTATDFSLINEAMNIGQRYVFSLHPFFLFAIVLIIAGVIKARSLLTYRIKKPLVRLIGIVASAGIMVSILSPIYLSGTVYSKTENIIRNQFMNALEFNDQFTSRGFVYSFLHSINSIFEPTPAGYTKEEAQKALATYSYDNIPEGKKINVISIMLESFNDFSKFDTIEFTNNPYRYLYELRSKCLYGQVFTNVFGGGTIKSEHSFLTGFSYQSDYRRPTNSYVHYMKQQGYTVEGGHPGNKWFYKRDLVNKFLGFDSYKFHETGYSELYNNNPNNGDTILEDKYFFEDILKSFDENKTTGKPYFNFSVSYQNHGPYNSEFLENGIEYVKQTESLSDGGYYIINNYLAGIEKTLTALKTMIDKIEAIDEPVMLVLFGDHNPWLGDESYVYRELGINLEYSNDDGIYNYFFTPYIIYTNKAAKEISGNPAIGHGGDFSIMYLMNKVFETNGWEGNEFIKATNELREKIDILTGIGLYRENGVFTQYPSEAALEKLNKFRYVQYYWRNEIAPKTPEEIASESAD
ncbi:MAG: LTA synthase family protein [Clostridia bacterium]|nr:LTA synthase family protein [Clostridia bacterium]